MHIDQITYRLHRLSAHKLAITTQKLLDHLNYPLNKIHEVAVETQEALDIYKQNIDLKNEINKLKMKGTPFSFIGPHRTRCFKDDTCQCLYCRIEEALDRSDLF